MTGRRLLAALSAGLLVGTLGTVGTSALFSAANADAPGLSVTIDTAPSAVGLAGDYSSITAEAADAPESQDTGQWTVGLHGDDDLIPSDIDLQSDATGSWAPVTLTQSGNDLTGDPGGGVVDPGQGAAHIAFRISVIDGTDGNSASSAELSKLTFTVGLLGDGVDASDSATFDVNELDPTVKASADVPLDTALILPVTLDNQTGSSYQDVVAIPAIYPGSGNGPGIKAGLRAGAASPSTALRKLKAAAASTDTTVKFEKDGTWTNIENVESIDDLPFVNLADGASSTTRWSFTFRDESLLDGSSPIDWLTVRWGGDFVTPTVRAADDPIDYVIGSSETEVAVTDDTPQAASGTAASTPKSTASDDGDTSGELAKTGSDVTAQGTVGMLLVAVGGMVLLATRRRRSAPAHPHSEQ